MRRAGFAAVDLGASSGRVMLGIVEREQLALHEVHRFDNAGVVVHGALQWDALRLWNEIQTGLAKAGRAMDGTLEAFGVDTWGVDVALLDERGRLLANPRHYRDRRTEGVPEKVFERVPTERVYAETGIEILPINTLYQLASMVYDEDPLLPLIDRILWMPDLFHAWASGHFVAERTIASTSQMLALDGGWATSLVEDAGLSSAWLPTLVGPGTRLGPVLADVARDLELAPDVQVVTPASHDTASAVAATSGLEHAAYLSCGTWSLFGMTRATPVTNEAARRKGFTNERGAEDTFLVQRNVMGLWPLQACRRAWQGRGRRLTWDDLTQRAEGATPFRSLIDLSDPRFLHPDDMEQLIGEACREAGMPPPRDEAEVARCCLESLALAHRRALHDLIEITGATVNAIRLVGGGSQNVFLAQATASACGVPVLAGPVEATAFGNVLVQAVATGAFDRLADARELLDRTLALQRYEPREVGTWDAADERLGRRAP